MWQGRSLTCSLSKDLWEEDEKKLYLVEAESWKIHPGIGYSILTQAAVQYKCMLSWLFVLVRPSHHPPVLALFLKQRHSDLEQGI